MHLTTEIRKAVREELKLQLSEVTKLIMGRGIIGNWVKQSMACALLNVKSRQLANIRIHKNKMGKQLGYIRWRKSRGNTIEYYKPDIEKYLNHVSIG